MSVMNMRMIARLITLICVLAVIGTVASSIGAVLVGMLFICLVVTVLSGAAATVCWSEIDDC